eukprot:3748251-Rhodomonas_salina.1
MREGTVTATETNSATRNEARALGGAGVWGKGKKEAEAARQGADSKTSKIRARAGAGDSIGSAARGGAGATRDSIGVNGPEMGGATAVVATARSELFETAYTAAGNPSNAGYVMVTTFSALTVPSTKTHAGCSARKVRGVTV